MSAAITLDMLRSASSAEFPVIDLGAYRRGEHGAQGRIAAQLREALENIGFLIVVNHGVSPTLTEGSSEKRKLYRRGRKDALRARWLRAFAATAKPLRPPR